MTGDTPFPPDTIAGGGHRFAVLDAVAAAALRPDCLRRGPFDAELAGAPVQARLDEDPPRWQIDLGPLGCYQFDAERGAVAILRPGGTAVDTSLALTGPVLLHALAHRGVFVLHASAIVDDGRGVIALIGDSGVGKSSFAARADEAGWRRVADDLLPIAIDADGRVTARPHLDQPKLAPEQQYPAGDAPALPLTGLLRLRRGAAAALTPLSPREATALAVGGTVASRLFPTAALGAHLAACARIGETVQQARLRAAELVVPDRPDAIDAAVLAALALLHP